ncbi:MAG TPA: ABC transporter permease [Bryobacteraceae bacterium]|jgi:predicted permease|nr:ABC transporter permease [Bryobacteraceae bacterium]
MLWSYSKRKRDPQRERFFGAAFGSLRQDLTYAVRMLRKSPGFTLAAVLSLAFGIGANTAIFSLVDSVLLRMLPVSHPEQLMSVWTKGVQIGQVMVSSSISNATFHRMRERASTVAGICASSGEPRLNVGWNGQAGIASGEFVSGGYFQALGVPAFLGRTFSAQEDRPDNRVAVLGFGYWQRRFGSDPGVIGRSISVNSVPFTVAAVTPPEFYGTSLDSEAEIMLPRTTMPQVQAGRISSAAPKPSDSVGNVIARIKPGVPLSTAAAELSVIFRQSALKAASPDLREREDIEKSWVELQPAGQGFSFVRDRFSESLKILLVVTGLVMLIACANIANLLLAKGQGRKREMAIRLSLGSSRWRLTRQLWTESLLLSFLGGMLGIFFAIWARSAIIFLSGLSATLPGGRGLRVLGFAAGVCVLNALLFGTLPALRATGVDFAAALKTVRTGRSAGRLPLARLLVVAQVSLSLALLAGAALFLATFRNLDRIDIGYDRDHSLLVTIDPSLAGYHDAAAKEVYRRILERSGQIPGVQSVSLMQTRLMTGGIMMNSVFVPDYAPRKGEDRANLWVMSNQVGADFFKTSGMRLTQGRDFSERDNASAPKVAIINQTMAAHFWEGRNPVGERIAWGSNEPPMTIVGVMRDIKVMGVRDGKQDLIFTPFLQSESAGSETLLVRTAGDPLRVAPELRAVIQSIDAKIPQFDVMTMNRQVETSLSQPRLLAILASLFGMLALGLAAIGLYGVLSYGVAQRTGEIGVRMALGARPASILRLILSEMAWLLTIGVALGIGISLVASRAVTSVLYEVSGVYPRSIAGAAIVLSAVAFLAGFLPARRASRIDPMAALRRE